MMTVSNYKYELFISCLSFMSFHEFPLYTSTLDKRWISEEKWVIVCEISRAMNNLCTRVVTFSPLFAIPSKYTIHVCGIVNGAFLTAHFLRPVFH